MSGKTINRVYLHSAIQAFAETGGGIFFLILLLKAGLSTPQALVALAGIFVGRFALRRGVLPLAQRIGLRRTLIIGTVFESSTYWLTPHVDGLNAVLFFLIGIGAIGSVLYWTSYHAYVAGTGDSEKRGAQVGAIEAINAIIAVIAPAIVSVMLVKTGPTIGYAVVGLVQLVAALPLLDAPEVAIPDESDGGQSRRREGAFIYFWDGWSVGGAHFLWMIALFVTLNNSLGNYGGTMVIAGLAGSVMSLLVGRFIDMGHGRYSVVIAYGIAVASVVTKALSFNTPWAAVAAAALGAIAASIRVPVVLARIYNLAQQSGCVLRFNMATEAGFDLGAASCSLMAAGMISQGWSIGHSILLAIPALAISAVLLWKSYGRA